MTTETQLLTNMYILQNYKNHANFSCATATSGLASVGVYVRGKFSGNLKVSFPFEFSRSPTRMPTLDDKRTSLIVSKYKFHIFVLIFQ